MHAEKVRGSFRGGEIATGTIRVPRGLESAYNFDMAIALNEELQAALQASGDRPVEAVDPATNKNYVVVARDQYDRLKPLFDDDPLSRSEQEHLLRRAGERAGWDDAAMDAYDQYDDQATQTP